MYVYAYMCNYYKSLYICIYIYVYTYLCIYIYVCIYIYMNIRWFDQKVIICTRWKT